MSALEKDEEKERFKIAENGEMDPGNQDDMTDNIMKGLDFYKQEKFREAYEYFDMALNDSPDNPNILLNLAMCMLQGNLYNTHAELMDIFDRIIAIDDKCKEAWANKGSYLAACGNLIDALVCLNRAAVLCEEPQVLENRGNVYLELGNYEMALQDFNRALQENPAKPDLIYKKGVSLMELQRFEEALECFDKVLASDYKVDETRLSKAEVLLDLGKLDETISVCDDILETDPDNIRAIGLKGISLHFTGDDDTARAELKRLKKIAKEKGMEKTQLIRILEQTLNEIDS